MEFVEIAWASPLYEQEFAFRDRLLRLPLGLKLTDADRAAESDQLHFGLLHDRRLVACAVIVLENESRAKLRQMAVDPSLQRRGLGSLLVRSIQDVLRKQGISSVELHARETARGFYEKLGYRVTGESFVEVTLPHRKMLKSLSDDLA